MKMLEYIHATLIVMLVLPVMYAVAGLKDADGEGMLYLKCLLIAVPIVVTGIAVRRLKNLGLYLLSCLAVTTAIWVVIRLFFGGSGALYPTVMTAESLFIGFIRFQERIRLARQEKEDDLYSAPAVSMLNQPSLGFLWYFAVMYAVGIIFNAKTLCDFAFWNGAVYFFAALAYAYQISTKHYLGLNKRTKSIPRKRLYAISAAMTGLFALLVFMAMVPSFFLGGQRRYTDIRTWLDGIEADGDWMGYQPEIGGEGLQGDDGIIKFLQNEPPPKPSEIWNYLWWIFVTLCAGLVVYGTIRTLQRVFGEFRDSFDENGDKVEALDEEPLHKEERIRQSRRKRQDSKTQRIRRMYRRTIQKHRKEPPARYESPSEIEKNAGLLGDADMERLHVTYENARYGRERV